MHTFKLKLILQRLYGRERRGPLSLEQWHQEGPVAVVGGADTAGSAPVTLRFLCYCLTFGSELSTPLTTLPCEVGL